MGKWRRILLYTAFALSSVIFSNALSVFAAEFNARKHLNTASLDFETWLMRESSRSIFGVLQNISPNGAVSASPSKEKPNYFYHWIRDSALTISEIVNLYEQTSNANERLFYESIINRFIEFSRKVQLTPNRSGGLGEPKFEMDGKPFEMEWGRPQNDGPALRAITLVRFAKIYLKRKGGKGWVKKHLYDGKWPSESVIKTDLEFVSNHWQERSFDLWEEVEGDHFYTRIVQRKALLDGADLADQLDDFGASAWYRNQAKLIESDLKKYWDASRNFITATLNRKPGDNRMRSGIDVAVILGVLHGKTKDQFLNLGSDEVLSTVVKVRQAFENIYKINKNTSLPPAIGRYPEDVYDGYTSGDNFGNPWVLSTCAYAEYYYRLATEWMIKGEISLTDVSLKFLSEMDEIRILNLRKEVLNSDDPRFAKVVSQLIAQGDAYLKRLQLHTPQNDELSEQINRDLGFMQGAADLTWSYVSFLSAFSERDKAVSTFKIHEQGM